MEKEEKADRLTVGRRKRKLRLTVGRNAVYKRKEMNEQLSVSRLYSIGRFHPFMIQVSKLKTH